MSGNPQFRVPSKPKVWIVAPSPPPYGGMSVQAEKLRTRLLAEGIAAEMIPTNPAPHRGFGFLARIPGARTVLREAQYLASLRRIVHDPGVVHHFSASYLFFFLHSAPLLLLGKWSPARVVLNYRGGKAADFLRHWSWAALPLMRIADQVVVPSGFLQQVFQNHGVSSSVLPNLADTELFPFVEREQLFPRLLVSRNLEPMYDVECVLRAFRMVQEKFPLATLAIAGEGSEAGRLRSLAQEWGLRGVTFYGAVPYAKLPTLYRQNDIYLNASRVDNFPGALVEAACAGLPIVSTGAGGIPEMIRDRENGLLAEVGDDRALARCVLELLDRQDFARGLARTARLWAEQFCWENVFPELLRCYGLRNEPAAVELRSERILVH
jgi:glycosyltransferase involved in cell wall biosynthesis